MLSRSIASLLIVLAASPFTAPFDTCDVSTLMSTPQAAGPRFIERAASIEDATAPSFAGSIFEDQFKDVLPSARPAAVPVFVGAVRPSTPAPRASVVRPPLLTLRL